VIRAANIKAKRPVWHRKFSGQEGAAVFVLGWMVVAWMRIL